MSSLIRATSLQGIDTLLLAFDADVTATMHACNINIDFTQLENQYLSYRSYAALLEYCAKQFNCPSFGLQLANQQSLAILGYIAIAANGGSNLGDALDWVAKYLHLHSPALRLTAHSLEDENHLFLSFEIKLKPLPNINQVTELTIALAMGAIKKLSNNQCKPITVFLPQKLAPNRHAYSRYFDCDVIEHRNSAGIVIAKKDLSIALEHSELSNVEAAQHFLTKHSQYTSSLPAQVSALIRPMLPIYQCSNRTIASALNMHPRTLHRELAKHNTSFVKLKDATRRALAKHYLMQGQLSISTISELLGYQEQATFTASAKRWFGCSPRAMRSKKC
ncbi:AraC family transcriptional regulator ligand-binding domain-containing protein [Pseudoalteromonas sp.]|uniref:AraC family transcriptional regulator n=1 Tax=Pseudoalteromonas sp. TaxID=53249 RepID=UPI00356AAE22